MAIDAFWVVEWLTDDPNFFAARYSTDGTLDRRVSLDSFDIVGFTYADGSLWAAGDFDGQSYQDLLRIDPDSGGITQVIDLSQWTANTLYSIVTDPDDGTLWVGDDDQWILNIDPSDGSLITSIDTSSGVFADASSQTAPRTIFFHDGLLYISWSSSFSGSSAEFLIYDRDTGTLVNDSNDLFTLTLDSPHEFANEYGPGCPATYDDGTSVILTTTSSTTFHIYVLDANLGSQSIIDLDAHSGTPSVVWLGIETSEPPPDPDPYDGPPLRILPNNTYW